MKHSKKVFTLIVTIFISIVVHGQEKTYISEMYLQGKWTATCPTEITDHASIQQCELCPFVINPDDKSKGETKDIEMTFEKDYLTLNQNGNVTTVPYTRNKDNHSFSFTLNNKLHNFRMFIYNKQRIIEDSDGLLMVLDKVK
jgi:hypothetical protein